MEKVVFTCQKCNKNFSTNGNLKCHVANNSCKIMSRIKCKLCDKIFTTNTSMYRHMRNICKIKKKEDTDKQKIYEKLLELQKQVDELRNKSDRLEERNKELENNNIKLRNTRKKVINNGTINNGTINNGTINNIVLIGCGKEDMAKIDKEDILKSLKKGFYSTLHLTEAVHFNPKYPEYHNVYISNIRDRYAMMYDGADWILTRKSELIDRLYEDKKNYIENNMEEFIKSLTNNQTKALERWLNTYDNHERIKEIKDMIKLLLYNKRDQVMEQWDQ